MRSAWLAGLFLTLLSEGCGSSAGTGRGDGGARLDGGGPTTDGGADDGGAITATDGGSAVPTRYPSDALLSPFTASVVQSLRGIAARSATTDANVFIKVGASGTVSTNLLYCFAGDPARGYEVDLDGRTELQPTIDHFRGGNAGGTTPFDRASLAALSGRSAGWAISGDPSPLEQEIATLNPRFALINYGTNDMNLGTTYRSALRDFHANMTLLFEAVLSRGIVPIVTGLNPRADSDEAARWVPTYDAVTRAMAESLQVPYIDLYLASSPLPDQGLLADGIHGNTYQGPSGDPQPCVFRPEGLAFNYNQRNLLTLRALDAVRRAVVEGASAPDSGRPVEGEGSAVRPFLIDQLPFTHASSTRESTERRLHRYPACDQGQDESGPERVYRLVLETPRALRFIVLDGDDVDVDVHLLQGDASAQNCLERNDWIIERTLEAGTYHLVVDSFVPATGSALAGPYLFIALPCEAGDPDC